MYVYTVYQNENCTFHWVQSWQKRREKLLKLKLCIFVLSRVHLECTNMILVKSDPTKVIKAKLKALRLPKSRLCTIIFVFYAAFESVWIELQSLWDLSWLKVLKAKKATRNIQNQKLDKDQGYAKNTAFQVIKEWKTISCNLYEIQVGSRS